MRYKPEHKQRSRERVIAEATNAIRRDGLQGLSVAGVMTAAGLTQGAFYAHFESREALLAAGIERMFEQGRLPLQTARELAKTPQAALAHYIGFYLSRSHRDNRTAGCPLPFLAADAPRLSGAPRDRYAAGVQALSDDVADVLRAMDDPDPDGTATSVLSELVGALSLARAEPDPVRSYEVLTASKAALKRRLHLQPIQ